MRAALAALYVALMARESVGLIDTGTCLVVDGGFASNSLYCKLLAALFPQRRVLVSEESEGTALGAALLWLESLRLESPQVPLRQVPVAAISGLSEYAEEWRRRAYAHAGIPNTQLAASERFSG